MKRKLKVSSSYRPKQSLMGKSSTCPFIRLKGKWLEQAGFNVGDQVSVYVSEGIITITGVKYSNIT